MFMISPMSASARTLLRPGPCIEGPRRRYEKRPQRRCERCRALENQSRRVRRTAMSARGSSSKSCAWKRSPSATARIGTRSPPRSFAMISPRARMLRAARCSPRSPRSCSARRTICVNLCHALLRLSRSCFYPGERWARLPRRRLRRRPPGAMSWRHGTVFGRVRVRV